MENTFYKIITKTCSKCQKPFDTWVESFDVCLDCEFPKKKSVSSNPQEIVIKQELIDTSKLKSDSSDKPYRPKDFDGYIGQENLKNILKGYITGCKQLNKTFPHFLVDGRAGTGKTAIAYILAEQLGVNFVECVASSIKTPQQLLDILVEVDGGTLFFDEIHTINKNIANYILPIIEDYHVQGKQIKQFTLFGATTEKGILLKKYKPLVDRFKIQRALESYTTDELVSIIKKYKNKVFPNKDISENTYNLLALNCRSTPRIAIRLLESLVYMVQPIENVLKSYSIVKNGITEEDIKLLSLLNANEKGLGLTTICAYLQTSKENYLYSIESHLIEKGYISISNKRQITIFGKEFLKGV